MRVRKPVNATQDVKVRTNPHERRDRLAFLPDPRYHTEWVNDLGDNVQRFLDAGYVFVSEKDRWGTDRWIQGEGNPDEGTAVGSQVAVNVGRAGGMENVTAYLMRMPIDEYEEMMAPMREEAKRPMNEIKRNIETMKRDGYYGGFDTR